MNCNEKIKQLRKTIESMLASDFLAIAAKEINYSLQNRVFACRIDRDGTQVECKSFFQKNAKFAKLCLQKLACKNDCLKQKCCANLSRKVWPLLNQPTSHGPFRPKLWMPIAILFVEIFQKEKSW